MSSHVFVKVKMRAVDARRVVREFKKEAWKYVDDSSIDAARELRRKEM